MNKGKKRRGRRARRNAKAGVEVLSQERSLSREDVRVEEEEEGEGEGEKEEAEEEDDLGVCKSSASSDKVKSDFPKKVAR